MHAQRTGAHQDAAICTLVVAPCAQDMERDFNFSVRIFEVDSDVLKCLVAHEALGAGRDSAFGAAVGEE